MTSGQASPILGDSFRHFLNGQVPPAEGLHRVVEDEGGGVVLEAADEVIGHVAGLALNAGAFEAAVDAFH